MNLLLERTYFPDGTNGELYRLDEGVLVCFTIELPNKGNARRISCIAEGRYELKCLVHRKFGKCLMVLNVPYRTGILIHTANDAKKELKGCIAPVRELVGNGVGTDSRMALNVLYDLVNKDELKGNGSFLTIRMKEEMNLGFKSFVV